MKECTICNKSFTRRSSYVRHVKNIHKVNEAQEQKQIYECFECKNRFTEVDDLTQHIEEEIMKTNFLLVKKSLKSTLVRYSNENDFDDYSMTMLMNSDLVEKAVKIVKCALTIHPSYKIGLIVNADYTRDNTTEEQDNYVMIPFRARYRDINRGGFKSVKKKIQSMISEIISREDDYVMAGSNWVYGSIVKVDLELVQMKGLNRY